MSCARVLIKKILFPSLSLLLLSSLIPSRMDNLMHLLKLQTIGNTSWQCSKFFMGFASMWPIMTGMREKGEEEQEQIQEQEERRTGISASFGRSFGKGCSTHLGYLNLFNATTVAYVPPSASAFQTGLSSNVPCPCCHRPHPCPHRVVGQHLYLHVLVAHYHEICCYSLLVHSTISISSPASVSHGSHHTPLS